MPAEMSYKEIPGDVMKRSAKLRKPKTLMVSDVVTYVATWCNKNTQQSMILFYT